jgi:hypothetical protein
LKEQAHITFESLKPINFLKDTIIDFTSQSDLKENVFDGIAGVTTGFLSKKLIVGTTNSPVKKLVGTLLQVGITALVTKNSSKIKANTSGLITAWTNPLYKRDFPLKYYEAYNSTYCVIIGFLRRVIVSSVPLVRICMIFKSREILSDFASSLKVCNRF